MFEGKTLWQIFNMGGFTMYVLLLCSIVSIGVIIERLMTYHKKSRISRDEFMSKIRAHAEKGDVNGALKLCDDDENPLASVVRAGLKKHGHEEKVISGAMEREIMVETVGLERYTTIVGTLGNIAVYIGLFGTVIGIINSFHNIAKIGSGGISVVIGGVAEALICTATGLSVAIPAVIAYNYFIRRIDNFVTDMEYCSSEVLDLLGAKGK
ncbi:MAG: MotA/TolQ/ExbB proton channel family protein [Endomicrobiales bacterium]|nr:MotA/TolQ/ExbB proton channel family protein [Endomicrobiales bacterium]